MPAIVHGRTLAAKRKREQEKREELKRQLNEKIKRRKSLQDQIMNVKKQQGAQELGAMGRVNHMGEFNPEAAAAEILFILFVNLFQTVFQIKYLEQKLRFSQAQSKGIAYEPDANGVFPKIYQLNEKNEAVGDPLSKEQISRALIRANGFVPPPSLEESMVIQYDSYLLQMFGISDLSPVQLERLNMANETAKEKAGDDDVFANGMLNRPRPTPAAVPHK